MAARAAGSGGRGGTADIYQDKAKQPFSCHSCQNWFNAGATRYAVRSGENSHGPETRAVAAMQAAKTAAAKAAAKAKSKAGGSSDNEEVDVGQVMRQAAMATFATMNVRVVLYVHEVVFFQELVQLEEFQFETKNGMGVRMICPSCRTNKFVLPPGVQNNGYPNVSAKRVRVAYDVDGVVVPLAGRYRCKNPQCDLVLGSLP
eukprot:g16209.t1